MGGYGSGRCGGRPTTESCLQFDLAWMLRNEYAKHGSRTTGNLSWSYGDESVGPISYTARMDTAGEERLELSYARGSGRDVESVRQTIRLTFTRPRYGGKRWWMICPYRGIRVGKLYMPPGGDRFASRQAWRLGYNIQRVSHRDRPFEALFRLQRKLGCTEGWDSGLWRPKGMWQRTFDRHIERYWELDAQCAVEMATMKSRLTALPNWGQITSLGAFLGAL